MDNITLASCSYNTPNITITMLKSFFKHHDTTPVLICENSTNEETVKLLQEHCVSFIRNEHGLHSPSVDILLKNCKTDYMLLVDTDVIFLKNHKPLFDEFIKMDLTLLGDICGDRGGKSLHYRVHPWHCFINVKKVKQAQIKFHDPERLTQKNSLKSYDIGATFFEDIRKHKLKIGDLKVNGIYYQHFEGMSWRTLKFGDKDGNIDLDPSATHNNIALYNYGLSVETAYKQYICEFEHVNIKAK